MNYSTIKENCELQSQQNVAVKMCIKARTALKNSTPHFYLFLLDFLHTYMYRLPIAFFVYFANVFLHKPCLFSQLVTKGSNLEHKHFV